MNWISLKKCSLFPALVMLCAACANGPPATSTLGKNVSNNEKKNKIMADQPIPSPRQNLIFRKRLGLVAQKKKYVEQLQRLPAIERVSNSTLRIKISTLEAQIQALDSEFRKPFVIADQAGKYQPYLDSCVAAINKFGSENYPPNAQGKLYGKASVSFSVLPNGEIRRLKLIRSTGQKILDDALIDAIVNASPCQPFPAWMASELDYLAVVAAFEFSNDGEK